MKRNKNFRSAGLAVLLVLVMVISSFSFLAGTGSAAAPVEKAKADNVLNIAMQDDVKTLNPCKASDVWSWNVIGWFYDSTITRDKNMELIPWMAVNWSYSTDNPTWANLTLRNDIRWSDGEPMDGNDLVFTYNFFAGAPGYGAQVPRYLSSVMPLIWDNNSDGTPDWVGVWVDPNDPYTVHYHLSEQSATFVTDTLAMFVLPEHIWKDHTGSDKFSWPTNADDYQKATVGTGLFKLDTWVPLQYTKLVANEDYFKGWPNTEHIDTIYFRIYQSTDAAVMALQSGEIDYIAWTIPPGYLPQLVQNSEITISQTDELGFFYMAWNLRRTPFNLLPLRQAMAHATDKQTIVSRLLLNYGSVGTSVVSPANKVWCNSSVTTYAYDLDAARAILDAQGWKDTDGDGWRELPDIGDREIVILTPPADYDPIRAEAGRMIADSCQKIGLNVVSKPTDFGTIVTKVYDEHDFDAYILGWSIGGLEPSYLQDFFTSPFDVPGGNNGIGLHNATFDAKVDAMMKELDETKRIEMNKELQESVAFNLYYNVLYYRANLEAYRNDKYTGWYAELGGVFNTWTLWELHPGTTSQYNIRVTGQEKISEGNQATLTVKVTDANGAAVSGATVTVTPTAGSMVQSTGTTDSNGIATFTYDGTLGLVAGDSPSVVTFAVEVDVNGVSTVNNYAFRMTVYPPDQKLATVSIELLQSTVTTKDMKYGVKAVVTVCDQSGVAIKGAKLDLDMDPSYINLLVEGNTTTDENGQSIITIKAPELNGTKSLDLIITLTAIAEGYTSGITTALLTVVYARPMLEMQISVSPENAETKEEILITVVVTDSHTGEPLANVSISLESDEPNTTFSRSSGITDAGGMFIADMTVSHIGRKSETVIVTATANATGYTGVMQTKEVIVRRAESTPDISFIGVMAVIAISTLISQRRKR